VVNQRGLSAFDLLRSWRHDHAAVLCAFDLIELDGKLRGTPIEERKQALAEVLCREGDGIVLNVHYDCDAKLSSSTPACSATRALCRSGSAHRCRSRKSYPHGFVR
jgi:ATP-dependent DNA ligase